jgi:hypothetical protein
MPTFADFNDSMRAEAEPEWRYGIRLYSYRGRWLTLFAYEDRFLE